MASPSLDAMHDRAMGCLVGSALGDAVGLYTEFLPRTAAVAAYPSGRFTLAGPNPTPFTVDTHRAPKEPGDWTDDTDHALLLVLSFLHTAKTGDSAPLPTQQDIAARLQVWVQQGLRPLDTMPLGLGRLVGTVTATQGFAAAPEATARDYWTRTGRRAAPNGSLMRTHPVGVMCVGRAEQEAMEAAAALSRVTHVDPRCVVACVAGTALVRGLVRGEVRSEGDVDGTIDRAVAWFEGATEKIDRAELDRHVRPLSLDALQLDDHASIGYVYKALGAGVVTLRRAMRERETTRAWRESVFEALMTDLVMRGGDADTNACFAGALLGAFVGHGALPAHWKHGLRHGSWLAGKAEALCRAVGVAEGGYEGGDAETRPDGGREPVPQAEMEARWMKLQQDSFEKVRAKEAKAKKKPKSWFWR